MKRKVTAMGNSQGVLIPKEYLERLGLKKGSEVEVQVDEEKGQILIFSISRYHSRVCPGSAGLYRRV
jgi:putative addiction module antidote